MRAIIISAPTSGSGKTVTTLILARALQQIGHPVVIAKSGPDFIDPTLHTRISRAVTVNLDPWAMRSCTLQAMVNLAKTSTDTSAPVQHALKDAHLLAESNSEGEGEGEDQVHPSPASCASHASHASHTPNASPNLTASDSPLNCNPSKPPLLLIEGAMGLFDGGLRPGETSFGSTADLARFLGIPILLTLDATGSGRTVGAIAAGLTRTDPSINIIGTIATKVASDRHSALVCQGLQWAGIPLLGEIRRNSELVFKSRHLGLQLGDEQQNLTAIIDRAAREFAKTSRLTDIVRRSRTLDHFQPPAHFPAQNQIHTPAHSPTQNHTPNQLPVHTPVHTPIQAAKPNRSPLTNTALMPSGDCRNTIPKPLTKSPGIPALGRHIAIAYDAAFCFIYTGQIELWRSSGARLSFFSPLADELPSPEADAIFLPGGYPELYAHQLSQQQRFKNTMLAIAERGTRIYGECGGYMVLGQSISTSTGEQSQMLGLLGHRSVLCNRFQALGYKTVKHLGKSCDSIVYNAHEFHYAKEVRDQIDSKFESLPPAFIDINTAEKHGVINSNVSGSFLHLIDCAEHSRIPLDSHVQ